MISKSRMGRTSLRWAIMPGLDGLRELAQLRDHKYISENAYQAAVAKRMASHTPSGLSPDTQDATAPQDITPKTEPTKKEQQQVIQERWPGE